MPPVDQSIFPNGLAAADMRMSTSEFYGGPQSLANISTNGLGNLVRQYITNLQPNYSEKADGSIQSYTTQTAIRPLAGLGVRVNFDHTNAMVSPRDFTNAAWIKSDGLITAVKNQIGRTGGANTASLITFGATGTISQSVTVTSTGRQISLDAKRVSGTDPLEWSLDGVSYSNYDFSSPRYLGISRNVKNDLTPVTTTGFYLRCLTGNSFLVDFANNCETTSGLGMEGDPVQSNLRSWAERYSFQSVDVSPFFTIAAEAQWCFFLEWWQCRDDPLCGIFRSDGHMNMSTDSVNGITGGGVRSGTPRICPTRRDLFNPIYANRVMMWRLPSGVFKICGNGADPATGTLALNGGMTHFDAITNGAGSATTLGGFNRMWAGRTIPTDAWAKAMTAVA